MSFSAKTNLNPVRLANVLAWAWGAYRLAPFYARYLHLPAARPFILCGQHSLPVFCFGVLLEPFGGFLLAAYQGPTGQIAANTLGAAGIVAVAAIFALSKKSRPASAAFSTTRLGGDLRSEGQGPALDPRRA
jgi:hypothetical protein